MSETPPGVGHTDSMESHDEQKQGEKKKSRRPASECQADSLPPGTSVDLVGSRRGESGGDAWGLNPLAEVDC
jgi:hypothetical protein